MFEKNWISFPKFSINFCFVSDVKCDAPENIIVEIWNILDSKIQNGKLHYIKLVETENNYVEYYGE